MSLFISRSRHPARLAAIDLAAHVRRLWQDHLHRKASRASLENLLLRRNDHLLEDIGIDRETGYRLLGDTLVQPHRGWDRWQG